MHLQVFGCAVYVPIAPTHRPKLGPQLRLGIYIGFHSASIINYIEPLTGEVFTARFADCHFDENLFPPLGGDKLIPEEWREITWNESCDAPNLTLGVIIFFYKLIVFKLVQSYNVKHITCTISCSSGLQNIHKLHTWKCSTFTIFTLLHLFTNNKKDITYTKKSSSKHLMMC